MLVRLFNELQALGIATSPLFDWSTRLLLLSFGGHAEGVGQRRLALLKLGIQRFQLHILVLGVAGGDPGPVLAVLLLQLGDRLLVATLIRPGRQTERGAQLIGIANHVLGQGRPLVGRLQEVIDGDDLGVIVRRRGAIVGDRANGLAAVVIGDFHPQHHATPVRGDHDVVQLLAGDGLAAFRVNVAEAFADLILIEGTGRLDEVRIVDGSMPLGGGRVQFTFLRLAHQVARVGDKSLTRLGVVLLQIALRIE
ncbi:hypothetical protein D3C78_1189310 [compost metagenome]